MHTLWEIIDILLTLCTGGLAVTAGITVIMIAGHFATIGEEDVSPESKFLTGVNALLLTALICMFLYGIGWTIIHVLAGL